MTAGEWPAWFEHQDQAYVDEMVELGGMTRPDATAKAESDWPVLLPEGADTPGQHFLIVESGGRRVATLWLGERDDERDGRLMWIYDIEVDADVRGCGHGRMTMELAEQEARRHGHDRIGLNVFAQNVAAIALYTSLGYEVTRTHPAGQNMLKHV